MTVHGLELPEAAAFPEMADKALGVLRAAFGNAPPGILGTYSKHYS